MVDWVLKLAGWLFQVVERPKGAKGFVGRLHLSG
jgi:hypothetical protein